MRVKRHTSTDDSAIFWVDFFHLDRRRGERQRMAGVAGKGMKIVESSLPECVRVGQLTENDKVRRDSDPVITSM